MLTLRDIMTRNVLVLSPETTLREAVDALAEQHCSGAPVLAGDAVVGVVSMSDIIDFQASTPAVPTDRDDDDDEDDDEDVAPEWRQELAPAGSYFTDMWAENGPELAERFATKDTREWDLLAEHTVAEVMSRRVKSLRPESNVQAAAALMIDAGIHRVLVIEGDRLCGIVTTMDVTRAVADQRLEPRRFVFGKPRG